MFNQFSNNKKINIIFLILICNISIAQIKSVAPSENKETLKDTIANKMEPEMVFIEGGTFNMETNEGNEEEKPIHSVTLSSFYICKFEITQSQWMAIKTTNPSAFIDCNDCPVESINFIDIQDFIKKINKKTRKKYRLPTEAEWEFATRGGNKSNNLSFSGTSSSLTDVAWYNENSESKTHPVGMKAPNELGLFDMSGNVWEWCMDWYGEDYYSTGQSLNPKGPAKGTYRVIRGGSYENDAVYCKVTSRHGGTIYDRSANLGFRLVLSK